MEKIRSLTPIQTFKKKFNKYTKKNFKILNETKKLHKQRNSFSREQIKEQSILLIMIHNPDIVKMKIEELSEITFSNKDNNTLKGKIISLVLDEKNLSEIKTNIHENFNNLINNIEKNSILKNIITNKSEEDKLTFLEELLDEVKEMNHLKKIQLLESEAVKNLDENSYTELIKLKSQLNRE